MLQNDTISISEQKLETMGWSVVRFAIFHMVGGEAVLACGNLLILPLSFLVKRICVELSSIDWKRTCRQWFRRFNSSAQWIKRSRPSLILSRGFAICLFLFGANLRFWYRLWRSILWTLSLLPVSSTVSIIALGLGISSAFVLLNGGARQLGLVSDLDHSSASSKMTTLPTKTYSPINAGTKTSLAVLDFTTETALPGSQISERCVAGADPAWSFEDERNLIIALEDDLEPVYEVSALLSAPSEAFIKQSWEMVLLQETLRQRYASIRDSIIPQWIKDMKTLIEAGGIDRSRVASEREVVQRTFTDFEASHARCKVIFARLLVDDSDSDGDGLAMLLTNRITNFRVEVQAELSQREPQRWSWRQLARLSRRPSAISLFDEESLRNIEARLAEAARKVQIIKDTYGPDPCLTGVFAQVKRDWHAFMGDDEIATTSRMHKLEEMRLEWPMLHTNGH